MDEYPEYVFCASRAQHYAWLREQCAEDPERFAREWTELVAGRSFDDVNGQVAIVVEHVTRLRGDLRPDWAQPAQPGHVPLHGVGRVRVGVGGRGKLGAEPVYAEDHGPRLPGAGARNSGAASIPSRR